MRTFFAILVLAAPAIPVAAQSPSPARLTVERIFARSEFRSAPLPTVQWLKDGRAYLDLRADTAGGSDIVRINLLGEGGATVMAGAARLSDESGRRLEIESFSLSPDEKRALLFHSSVRVWRANTKGTYHVLDLESGALTPVSRQPGLQMFAKFSPDGRQVAFVRDNDLFVTDLTTGVERRLTTDGSETIINGTTDWVYEEELDLRDAFRWSPNGRRIAYWRFDQSRVPPFPMVNEMTLYPEIQPLRYPKAGAPNSAVRVGVLDLASGATTWIDVGADTGIYLARMEWVGADSVLIQRLPRKQNRIDVLMASATTGHARLLLTERDSAYVDVDDQPVWLDGDRQFLWSSDRSGWRQVYLYNRDGRMVRRVTRDGMDVLSVLGVDGRRGWVYVQVAGPTPLERQVYRYSLDGRRAERVTRAGGNHRAVIDPNARFLLDYHNTITSPTTVTLYELPAMTRRRVVVDNAALAAKLAALDVRPPEFFTVPTPAGVRLDAYRIVPADFDTTRKYPVLMYAYGGPAAPTVYDGWGGNRYLWHQMLAQQGFVVVSVDNRGAAWRGRAFRKITQYQLGRYESQDQIDAAKWLATLPWVDAERIGIWGWSYGGYLAALTAARGGDVFQAAIAVAPVTDWRLYDTIYTERYMWTPQENAEGYRESAPLNHVKGLTARLLLAHGLNDDNVHPQNTIQLADALQRAGKSYYLLVYPNKTHSISGGESQAHLFGSMTRFLIENLQRTAAEPGAVEATW